MSALSWIVLSTVAGALLSVLAAAAASRQVSASRISTAISYAVGALLGAVFLEILPHALETASSVETLSATVLAGILAFFVLEKLVLWRHCHVESCEGHQQGQATNDQGRSGLMILIGDTIHNFVDGILIAAAFLTSTELGIVTAIAIIAHEIPQEVGDFLILLNSGFSRARALAYNLLSSAATLLGGLLAWSALQSFQSWIAPLLALAAANMIYVAVADLIPGLHKRPELKHTVQQVSLIALGVISIVLVQYVVEASAG